MIDVPIFLVFNFMHYSIFQELCKNCLSNKHAHDFIKKAYNSKVVEIQVRNVVLTALKSRFDFFQSKLLSNDATSELVKENEALRLR